MQRIEQHQSFGGSQEVWRHFSKTLQCDMNLAVYLPPNSENKPLPVVYWLSGLTCSEQNFITKAAYQRYAAEHQLIVVAPDTSPRGEQVADDPRYHLGQGAGFYLNATQAPWAAHYQMYDYVVEELPALIASHFPTNGKQAIMGHSMGGHGALVIALRNPQKYQSVSAFAPILAPSHSEWGQIAFRAYLGENPNNWQAYDANALVQNGHKVAHLRIDQGLNDEFLPQLGTDTFAQSCRDSGQTAEIYYRQGYDHSYYFIASFIAEHFAFHTKYLA